MLSEYELQSIEQRANRAYGLPEQAGVMRVVQSDITDLIAAVRKERTAWAVEKDALIRELSAARCAGEIRDMMAKRDEGSLLRRNERIVRLEADVEALKEKLAQARVALVECLIPIEALLLVEQSYPRLTPLSLQELHNGRTKGNEALTASDGIDVAPLNG